MKVLYIFSGSYPYSVAGENTFIPQELDKYCAVFDKVILIPRSCEGFLDSYHHENLEILTDYSNLCVSSKKSYKLLIRSLFSYELWMELFRYNPLFYCYNPKRFLAILSANYFFYQVKDLLTNILVKYDDASTFKCVMTYWFDETTTVISRLKININSFVTRSHGYDLYDFRSRLNFFPFRFTALEALDFVFTASYDGMYYLRKKYPKFCNKIIQASLGMYNPNIVNKQNNSQILKIVSCSFLQPVKRIDKIIDALIILENRGKIKIEWTHIGNGPLFNIISQRIKSFEGKNVEMKLLSFTSQKDLFKIYEENPFDLFLNVSQSEGRPVSIMESLACGIPVLATNVGGNPEIVNDKVGYLIDVNFSVTDLADILEEINCNRVELFERRKQTFHYWDKNFNADHCFDFIIERIFTRDENTYS